MSEEAVQELISYANTVRSDDTFMNMTRLNEHFKSTIGYDDLEEDDPLVKIADDMDDFLDDLENGIDCVCNTLEEIAGSVDTYDRIIDCLTESFNLKPLREKLVDSIAEEILFFDDLCKEGNFNKEDLLRCIREIITDECNKVSLGDVAW